MDFWFQSTAGGSVAPIAYQLDHWMNSQSTRWLAEIACKHYWLPAQNEHVKPAEVEPFLHLEDPDGQLQQQTKLCSMYISTHKAHDRGHMLAQSEGQAA